MKKTFAILAIILLNTIAAFSQELHLVVTDKPLNDVLRSLPVEISFDDNALAKYNITLNKKFNSPKEALDFLLKDKPFRFENINGVFVITSYIKKKDEQPPVAEIKKYYTYLGTIRDAGNEESLPLPSLYIAEMKVSQNG